MVLCSGATAAFGLDAFLADVPHPTGTLSLASLFWLERTRTLYGMFCFDLVNWFLELQKSRVFSSDSTFFRWVRMKKGVGFCLAIA